MAQFKDLSRYTEYTQALTDHVWAYFYMRGVEGYYNNRHNAPVYKHSPNARRFWKLGHDHAYAAEPDEMTSSYYFCTAFLTGRTHHLLSGSQKMGYNYRKKYEDHIKNIQYENEGEPTMARTNVLYQVIGKDIYGTKRGVDSKGRVILELQGEKGGLKPYAADKIEEVMPYTVHLLSESIDRHYQATAGEYSKGDIVVIRCDDGPMLAEVREINTKNKSASTNISGLVVGKISFTTQEVDIVVGGAPKTKK